MHRRLVAVVVLALCAPAAAQVPRTLTVQGILRDTTGSPVDGMTSFAFSLTRPDGTVLWQESWDVDLRAGLFTLGLGQRTAIEPSVFDGPAQLRVAVDGEPMDPIVLTSVPWAFRAESADRYDGDVSWGQLVDVPADLADGDDGTAYAAGAGIRIAGTVIAVDSTTVQMRVSGACPVGSAIRTVAIDGTVECEADDQPAYSAEPGLALAGTTFSVDTASIQARVTGICPAGSSIRAVAADGAVTCEIDDTGSYSAGAGLTLTGTTFAVDTAAIQARVTGSCAAGSSIRAIAADGTVLCEADDAPSYSAGAGLTLTGTTFAVDTAAIQARVAGACPAGSSIRAIAADGAVTCEPDDAPSYSAGAGLTLTGTTFAVDTAAVQARVTGSCAAGEAIRAIAADGTVTCEVDDAPSYSAGAGLTLSGTTFAVDTAAIQARVGGACAAGSSIRAIAADGTVTCQPSYTDAQAIDALRGLCGRVRTASARTYTTLNAQLDADFTGAGVCGTGYHVCNYQEVTVYGILGQCEPGNSWIVGGFSNIEAHRRAIWNGQDTVQCNAGNYPAWYPPWPPYRGRVHCTSGGSSLPVACCENI